MALQIHKATVFVYLQKLYLFERQNTDLEGEMKWKRVTLDTDFCKIVYYNKKVEVKRLHSSFSKQTKENNIFFPGFPRSILQVCLGLCFKVKQVKSWPCQYINMHKIKKLDEISHTELA